MSTTTFLFFMISASTFAILLALAVALFLRNKSSASRIATNPEVPSIAGRSYTCDVEMAVLGDTIQITNQQEKPMRLEATSAGQGLELISSDQWVQKFSDGVNSYRVYASSVDEQFEQVALELKVTSAEVSVRPMMKTETVQIMIWKLKPVLLASAKHLAERQVFSGRLLKTLNFDRANGKCFRIRVVTENRNGSKAGFGMESRSNITSRESHKLLTMRIEPNKVVASNVSNRRMLVSVDQENSQSTLKRRLDEEDAQEMPLNGTFAFSILPGKSDESKKLLCIKISEQSIVIEPYTKFGTVPLICDVRTPGSPPDDEATSQIIAGEVMSELQLPRKCYTYILLFYIVAANSEAETSYTLQ